VQGVKRCLACIFAITSIVHVGLAGQTIRHIKDHLRSCRHIIPKSSLSNLGLSTFCYVSQSPPPLSALRRMIAQRDSAPLYTGRVGG
jgi:hypothetical protein